MMDIKQLVIEFAGKSGLAGLSFDENDIAGIMFDDMVLNIHADSEAGDLSIFLRLGDVPADQAERLALYAFLLKKNNFARQIGDCVLGVDEGEEGAYLCRRFAAETMDLPRLELIVEAFLNLAESLRSDLRTAGRQEPKETGHFPAAGLRRA